MKKTVCCLVAAVVLSGCSSPESEAKARARRTIETCWDNQEKKSNTPDMARMIAGACEKLEDDFRARFSAEP